MNLLRGPMTWGVVLILIGLALLANNFGAFGDRGERVIGIILGAGGLLFFAGYFTQRGAWWFLFPAFVLSALGALILLNEFGLGAPAGGSLFLWAIAAAFWGAFATDRRQWWAIIPAGVMTTIGLMPLASRQLHGEATGAVFFVGLGATFAVVYLLRARYGGVTRWAIYPATACVLIALVILVAGPLERFWPVIFLIVPGLWLLYNALRKRPVESPSPPPDQPEDTPG